MAEKYLSTNPYIGTRDFYPEEMRVRNWFFSIMRKVAESYGYEEILGPILEPFDVFAAKSGEEIVKEQTYHFTDRGERHMAVRPEMTPTVARMTAAKLGELRMPVRWYSIANFMRYERPQKGRLREFWQLNLDLLGEKGLASDYEIVSVAVSLLKAFGADESMFKVKINNRRFYNDVMREVLKATPDEMKSISKAVDKRSKLPREKYEEWLKESGITQDKIDGLDRIFGMPLKELLGKIPSDSAGGRELNELFGLIEKTGLAPYCEFDFSIVRGLDYYTGNVFEVNDLNPENRRALFGGGRYDNLIGLFKNAEVSGIGFGFGDVTFQNFLEGHGLIPPEVHNNETVLITVFDDVEYAEYIKLSDELREKGIGSVIYSGENKKMGRQFQYAESAGMDFAVIMGGDELKAGKAIIKNLSLREQRETARNETAQAIFNWRKEKLRNTLT
ncbi:MAG: histidine--tRNA ligase [Spirochaetes bacterium GWF1_51_8]|nr:MAG: histidine--tRNA ligase [Spirochaetes bacterium GWF1_51_8]